MQCVTTKVLEITIVELSSRINMDVATLLRVKYRGINPIVNSLFKIFSCLELASKKYLTFKK